VTFRVSIITAVVSAVVGISMAFCGYGVWALVWSSILSNVAGVVARMFCIDWRPRFECDLVRLKPLFSFGWKMMASSLLSTLVTNINSVLIGRFYTKADLAFVNRGRNIPELIGNNIRASIIESSFPVLSKLSGDRQRMSVALHRLLSVSMFVLSPVMTLLAVTAPRLIVFLYGERWTACVPYVQLACVNGLLWTVSAVNTTAVTALGRSGWLLKVGIVMNAISLCVMFVFLPHGVLLWVIAGTFITTPIALVLYVLLARRLVDFGFRSQVRDVRPTVLLTLAMAVSVATVGLIPVGNSAIGAFLMLVAQGTVAVAVYIVLAFAFRVSAFGELLKIVAVKMPDWLPFRNFVLRRFELD